MKINIDKGVVKGQIFAPPSKSYAHRLLICAFLSKGDCVVENVAFSEDILETLNCLKNLGANFTIENNCVKFHKEQNPLSNNFSVSQSGSTLRFFIPLALAFFNQSTFNCGERLFKRGVSVYQEIFDKQINLDNRNSVINLNGRLKGGNYKIKGDVSSQFITGLMFSLPLLNEDSYIEIIPPFESSAYVDITIDTLKYFGIEITKINDLTFFIKGNQKYLVKDCVVEGDYSNSAFFDAFNYIGGKVEVKGLKEDSKQGDKEYQRIFEKLKKGYCEIDLSNCPDLAPIVFVVASLNHGGNFTGTKRLRIKESDRGLSMKEELEKVGCKVDIFENNIIVKKGNLVKPTSLLIGHNDHRIVMSLSVLLTKIGGKIDGVESVNKSYPNFFSELEKLSVGIRYEE